MVSWKRFLSVLGGKQIFKSSATGGGFHLSDSASVTLLPFSNGLGDVDTGPTLHSLPFIKGGK